MELGWLDVCLRVADIGKSRAFYEGMGFHRVEGEDSEGWAVVVNGDARIGLYTSAHMAGEPFTLNFRGGDVQAIAEALKAKGYVFTKEPHVSSQGGASAHLKDPDGYEVFLDTAPGETKKT
jgi:catechol 2,3-dioxygenase-like lactoylglutathione lyase family enzyme